MFQKHTVFIIGAGASFEVGLPLGTELKSRIADALRFRFERFKGQTDGDYELFDALKQKYGDKAGAYTTAGSELSKVIPTFPSMDEALNYFSSRPEVIETGKIAIVAEILRSEQNSVLRINPQIGRPDPNAADSTWLGHFFQSPCLQSNKMTSKASFPRSPLSISIMIAFLNIFCFGHCKAAHWLNLTLPLQLSDS